MCLVSYVPTSKGFIISSNRDEAPKRQAEALVTENNTIDKFIFPQDTKGGSWFFASKQGKIAVVLNGALIKHKHQPPYKISRGLMLKAFFNYPKTSDFIANYDFIGIEPFTALLYNGSLNVFYWDGSNKHIETLDLNKPHVFSSCTLYSPETQEKRAALFYDLLEGNTWDLELIQSIHRTGNLGNPAHNFQMQIADRVKTISISHIEKKNGALKMIFENLQDNSVQEATI